MYNQSKRVAVFMGCVSGVSNVVIIYDRSRKSIASFLTADMLGIDL